ncbi:hypothetical protein [Solimicrobium silvestre]|uniref:Uncharacterized protein n=1 Tax=Solimicrobium silvestre TaxID=2099400 RepID=A0A2S9H367_9BURK|nr:hypothetical protein [Solimicrobium silvestre]PRC94418.1 hypothetical protein S2091_1039 [Solimicrobium silvestre]
MKIANSVLLKKIRHAIDNGNVRKIVLASDDICSHYRERECHDNVADWIASHPNHHAVLGWLITAQCVFALHSVVDTGTELLDITPRPEGGGRELKSFIVEDFPHDHLPPQLIDSGYVEQP